MSKATEGLSQQNTKGSGTDHILFSFILNVAMPEEKKYCGTQRHATTGSHLMSSRYLEIKNSITNFWHKYSFI